VELAPSGSFAYEDNKCTPLVILDLVVELEMPRSFVAFAWTSVSWCAISDRDREGLSVADDSTRSKSAPTSWWHVLLDKLQGG